MAISQDRMIALINAGLDYQNAVRDLISEIHLIDSDVQAGKKSPQYALNIIVGKAHEYGLLRHKKESPETILAEHLHFLRNSRRNVRAAAKLEERRRYEGREVRVQRRPPDEIKFLEMPERGSAPRSMVPANASRKKSLSEEAKATEPTAAERQEEAKLNARDAAYDKVDFDVPADSIAAPTEEELANPSGKLKANLDEADRIKEKLEQDKKWREQIERDRAITSQASQKAETGNAEGGDGKD